MSSFYDLVPPFVDPMTPATRWVYEFLLNAHARHRSWSNPSDIGRMARKAGWIKGRDPSDDSQWGWRETKRGTTNTAWACPRLKHLRTKGLISRYKENEGGYIALDHHEWCSRWSAFGRCGGSCHPSTCGNCQRSWCDVCDPTSVSWGCHWCYGRGYSIARMR